jgi:DNA-binding transcriptional ArsR family regulator
MPPDPGLQAAGPEPLPERVISDVETLRALSDPLRLRILEIMTATPDATFTVKRLATALETSATKLYHHVNLLLERGLINVAGQRVVSGIIETSYRVGQLTLRLDRSLLAADAPVLHETLTTLFDGARDDIERGLRSGVISIDEDAPLGRRLLLSRGLARLEPERAAAFGERLRALVDEFGVDDGGAPLPDSPDRRPAYGLVMAFFPLAEPTDAPDEETDR